MWRLVLSNLLRKKARTGLTFLSLVVAFLLFMLLRAVAAAFSGVTPQGADRLVVDARYSMTENLPLAYVTRIRALDGVREVTQLSWFGGFYREPRDTFPTYPVDPSSYFEVMADQHVAAEALERFRRTRIGALASRSLAERYGWSVGDTLPITGNIWPKQDGSWHWEFELVGTFRYADDALDLPLLLVRYDYYNEAVAGWARDQVGWLAVRVRDPARAAEIARSIDALFENSPDPVRTASEDEYNRQFTRQLGDIGVISSMILGAVFFTLLLLTANTASQAFRERLPELAMIKSLGFTDLAVAGLVLAEAVALCGLGGSVGIGAALLLEPVLDSRLEPVIGSFHMSAGSALAGVTLAVALGVAIGAPPAWAARRLAIVDALRAD